MHKVKKTLWRTDDPHKDLLALEPGRITVLAYDLTPAELPQMIAALEEVLDLVAPPEGAMLPSPAAPAAPATTAAGKEGLN